MPKPPSISPRAWLRLVFALPALVLLAWINGPAPVASAAPVLAALPESVAARAPAKLGLQTLPFDGGSLVLDTRTPRCRLLLRGAVYETTVRHMHNALQQIESQPCTSRVLQLEPSQTQIGSAMTLGAMLRNRRFDTEVSPGHTCDTPCTLLFVAGTQRALPVHPLGAKLALTRLPPDTDLGAARTCGSEPSAAQQLSMARYLGAMLPDAVAVALWKRIRAMDCHSNERMAPTEALRLGLATTVIALP